MEEKQILVEELQNQYASSLLGNQEEEI